MLIARQATTADGSLSVGVGGPGIASRAWVQACGVAMSHAGASTLGSRRSRRSRIASTVACASFPRRIPCARGRTGRDRARASCSPIRASPTPVILEPGPLVFAVRANDRLNRGVGGARGLNHRAGLKRIGSGDHEEPRAIDMRRCEDVRSRRVAVEERAPLRSERLDNLPALLDGDAPGPPLLERRADRAADPAEADDDGVSVRPFLAGAAVAFGELAERARRALEGTEELRPSVEPPAGSIGSPEGHGERIEADLKD